MKQLIHTWLVMLGVVIALFTTGNANAEELPETFATKNKLELIIPLPVQHLFIDTEGTFLFAHAHSSTVYGTVGLKWQPIEPFTVTCGLGGAWRSMGTSSLSSFVGEVEGEWEFFHRQMLLAGDVELFPGYRDTLVAGRLMVSYIPEILHGLYLGLMGEWGTNKHIQLGPYVGMTLFVQGTHRTTVRLTPLFDMERSLTPSFNVQLLLIL